MKQKLDRFIEQLPSFIILGIGISLVVGILIMFSYVVVWGVLLGGVIWLGVVIKSYLFPDNKPKHHKNRIIEHEEND